MLQIPRYLKNLLNNDPLLTVTIFISSPGQSPGRAIVTPGIGGGGVNKNFNVKVFYMMGKALSSELSCPCDSSCYKVIFAPLWSGSSVVYNTIDHQSRDPKIDPPSPVF